MRSPLLPLKLATTAVLALSLGLAACGKKPEGGMPKGMAAEVGVVTVQTEAVNLTTVLSGRTSAYLVSDVRPQVSGIVKQRLFTEGGYVQQGQSLYQIDAAPFHAAVNLPDVLDVLKRALLI